VSESLVQVLSDRGRCIGAGQCVLAAPEFFDQSEDDGKVLIVPAATLVPEQAARAAVGLCPSRALSLARP
jgi:ferredoxin